MGRLYPRNPDDTPRENAEEPFTRLACTRTFVLFRLNTLPGPPNELRQVGIEDAEGIAKPSNTNDFNFIVAVTLSTSFLALVIGVVLPGDWGAFGSYLVGGISLAVLGAFLDRSPYATSSSSSVVRFSPHDTPRHVKRHLL